MLSICARLNSAVHPRLCGEHGLVCRSFLSASGSSPPVRGTPASRRDCRHLERFIPACAGNTRSGRRQGRIRTVHPRLCGEHQAAAAAAKILFGSSPPVRGTLRPARRGVTTPRFIPACAGNTSRTVARSVSATVHPRLCGEHACAMPEHSLILGSSPPVRGTQAVGEVHRHGGRFIPACAGNTRPVLPLRGRPTVHPRLCGEHAAFQDSCAPAGGSSPPVRGTRLHRRRHDHVYRFIPACAGNTDRAGRWKCARAVHPRLCGEHASTQTRKTRHTGSSPPVRGTPYCESTTAYSDRFIPACAGNTCRSKG